MSVKQSCLHTINRRTNARTDTSDSLELEPRTFVILFLLEPYISDFDKEIQKIIQVTLKGVKHRLRHAVIQNLFYSELKGC